jgi:hypothetical protein
MVGEPLEQTTRAAGTFIPSLTRTDMTLCQPRFPLPSLWLKSNDIRAVDAVPYLNLLLYLLTSGPGKLTGRPSQRRLRKRGRCPARHDIVVQLHLIIKVAARTVKLVSPGIDVPVRPPRSTHRSKPSSVQQAIADAGEYANLVAQLEEIALFQVVCTDFTELRYADGQRKAFLMLIVGHVSKMVYSWAVRTLSVSVRDRQDKVGFGQQRDESQPAGCTQVGLPGPDRHCTMGVNPKGRREGLILTNSSRL